jgi:hypothetical protein
MSLKRVNTLISVSIIFLTASSKCFSQKDSLTFVNFFKSRPSVQWRLSNTNLSLGNRCKAGDELVTFFSNNKVITKKCEKEVWNEYTETWAILKVKNGWQLLINERAYEFSFQKKKNTSSEKILTLRSIPQKRYDPVTIKRYNLN